VKNEPEQGRKKMTALEYRTESGVLGRQDCWRLLATHPVGRVAVVANGWPTIFPVTHHVVDYDTIAFRSDDVPKLTDAGRGRSMSLEVDGIDDEGRLWSVAVTGVGREAGPEERARLRELGHEPGSAGHETHWMVIRPEIVTGHRYGWLEWSAH
jgi:uncharacterized protein